MPPSGFLLALGYNTGMTARFDSANGQGGLFNQGEGQNAGIRFVWTERSVLRRHLVDIGQYRADTAC